MFGGEIFVSMTTTAAQFQPVATFNISTWAEADYLNHSGSATTVTLFNPDDKVNVSVTLLAYHGECRVVYRQFKHLPWNNPDNVVTMETMVLLLKILGGVFIPLLSSIGVAANVLNCLVFFHHGLRDRINMLLFSLACADFLVTAYMFLYFIEYFYTEMEGEFEMYGPLTTYITNSWINTLYGFVYVSAFISTVIAVERWFCITHPFTAKRVIKTRTTAIAVSVCGGLLVGTHYIVSDKYRIYCQYFPLSGFQMKSYYPSPFYLQHTQLVDVLNGVVYGVGLPCLFVLVTTVTTAVTAVKLKSTAAWRRDQRSGSQMESKEVALTRMLIAVSCLFIACTLPNILVRVAPFFLPEFRLGGRHQNLLVVGALWVHFSPTVNSSLNFFFYFKMGTRFRKTLASLCCRCVKVDVGASGMAALSSTSVVTTHV